MFPAPIPLLERWWVYILYLICTPLLLSLRCYSRQLDETGAAQRDCSSRRLPETLMYTEGDPEINQDIQRAALLQLSSTITELMGYVKANALRRPNNIFSKGQ